MPSGPASPGDEPRPSEKRPETSAPSPETLVIGLIGGIAAGKSTVARLLAGPKGLVLSADAIAHDVLASPEVSALVAERFGPEALGPDGAPDRAVLAARVFDPEHGEAHRRALEGWTHPRVRATISARMREARAAGVPWVVLDVPLLLENDHEHGWINACDALVFIDVPLAERRRRAATRGWAPDELSRREAAQLALEEKRSRADFVLLNDADLDVLEQRVNALLSKLRSASGRERPSKD